MTTTTTVTEKVTADLTAAMKAKDAAKTSALRMAKAALMNREIDKKASLDDTEALAVIRGRVKQREASIFQFRKANRPELAGEEVEAPAALRGAVPAGAPDGEIEKAVDQAMTETGATPAKDTGRAMKAALAALAAAGKPADGKRLNDAVRKRLGA